MTAADIQDWIKSHFIQISQVHTAKTRTSPLW